MTRVAANSTRMEIFVELPMYFDTYLVDIDAE